VSQLIDSKVILKDICETDGAKVLAELAKPFPFKVPNVFKKDPFDQMPEINWAPITDPKGIRYRKDTLFDALDVEGVTITEAQLRAVESIEDALGRIPSTDYSLEAGDVIFVNNYRILHGRTAFVDPDRLMLRVRMK
jgi:alpha-ketoglutarate-dependent taurine dioxygenase